MRYLIAYSVMDSRPGSRKSAESDYVNLSCPVTEKFLAEFCEEKRKICKATVDKLVPNNELQFFVDPLAVTKMEKS